MKHNISKILTIISILIGIVWVSVVTYRLLILHLIEVDYDIVKWAMTIDSVDGNFGVLSIFGLLTLVYALIVE